MQDGDIRQSVCLNDMFWHEFSCTRDSDISVKRATLCAEDVFATAYERVPSVEPNNEQFSAIIVNNLLQ